MILATHALAGAAVAELFPEHPVLGFFAGFISHFILDSIPHQDYRLGSIVHEKDIRTVDMEFGAAFRRDILKIALDCAIGFGIIFILFPNFNYPLVAALVGGIGGVTPDALQFVYFKLRGTPLRILQRFHGKIQRSTLMRDKLALSLLTQALLLTILYCFLFLA